MVKASCYKTLPMSGKFAFKSLMLLLLVVPGFFLSSCSNEEEDKKKKEDIDLEDYYEFQVMDMSKYGIDAYIHLPDETANIGASTKPEVSHPEDHIWQIDIGQNFTLHIEDMANIKDNIKEEKKELKRKEFFKIKYLIDDEDMILYQRELVVKGSDRAASTVGVEHKSYHVFGQKTVDGITYVLESREEGYEKNIIEMMAKSIKSFKPKSGK
ncbi:MAG: hypothetical protein DCO96_13700 [Fluviicola sp. XM-24bin1]|nr:MAG: hypothetical protein DCO96_13700 [Fluviicola sp. XM-24bin1]